MTAPGLRATPDEPVGDGERSSAPDGTDRLRERAGDHRQVVVRRDAKNEQYAAVYHCQVLDDDSAAHIVCDAIANVLTVDHGQRVASGGVPASRAAARVAARDSEVLIQVHDGGSGTGVDTRSNPYFVAVYRRADSGLDRGEGARIRAGSATRGAAAVVNAQHLHQGCSRKVSRRGWHAAPPRTPLSGAGRAEEATPGAASPVEAAA